MNDIVPLTQGPEFGVRHPAKTDCHGGHCDQVETFDRHHVVEHSEGGASTPENLVIICPNMHRWTHDLYAMYEEYNGPPPFLVVAHFPRIARRMALARWEAKKASKDRPFDQKWRLYQ